jgi:hypothetical protein
MRKYHQERVNVGYVPATTEAKPYSPHSSAIFRHWKSRPYVVSLISSPTEAEHTALP